MFGTSTTGTELTRIKIPGRTTRFTDTSGPDGWSPTAEPPHRINQIYLEPILLEYTAGLPGVTPLLLCRVDQPLAWRGDTWSDAVDSLVARLRGAASAQQATARRASRTSAGMSLYAGASGFGTLICSSGPAWPQVVS